MRQEELSKAYVVMGDNLASFNLEIGSYKDVTKWVSEIIKVEYTDENAHRKLIREYTDQDCRSKAPRQFQQCQRVLSKELGIEQAPETKKLFQMLVSGRDNPTRGRAI